MNTYAWIKRTGKTRLRNNWGRAITIFAVLFSVYILIGLLEGAVREFLEIPVLQNIEDLYALDFNVAWPSLAITGGSALFYVLLFPPLTLGAYHWFYSNAQDRDADLELFFHFLSSPKGLIKSIWLQIQLWVRRLLIGLLAMGIPIAAIAYSSNLLYSREENTLLGIPLFVVGLIGLVLGAIFYFWWTQRYFLVYYLISERPELPVTVAIRQSVALMKPHKSAVLLFKLSYTGWFCLCALALPAIFVLPYYWQSLANYAQNLLIEQRNLAARQTQGTPQASYQFG